MERDLRIVPSDIVPAGTNAPRPSHRLAETADDVPAQLMQEFQDLWNDLFDYPDGRSPAEVTDEELTDSFACGYSPACNYPKLSPWRLPSSPYSSQCFCH
jgi:hypothetical protein